MENTENTKTDAASDLSVSAGYASEDNPPTRLGGHPTIFTWCSKAATSRRKNECANLQSHNVEMSRGVSRCDQ